MNSGTKAGTIVKVSGPLVVAEGMAGAKMYDVVRVSDKRLIGEIIEMRGDRASIQVYEETAGLGPGQPVFTTGEPLSVELGPGLIGSIYDGIQRPLDGIRAGHGDRLPRGVELPGLNRERKWDFVPVVQVGAAAPATSLARSRRPKWWSTGSWCRRACQERWNGSTGALVADVVARIKGDDGTVRDVTMMQKWPVRRGRPYAEKLTPSEPLITGQRVLDTFFPVAKGGTACIPGPFGSGKTVVQHQLAKWADADIIVYVGCGERGNEMTDVLMEFPELLDPRTGEPLMKRTVLVANTSDMPVAARESSVYTGITIAEYFRDMGYSVALMADSTSRWAEALREMSGRLEEMPGEEGYPAYLGSRVSEFYERAGRVKCLSSDEREGSLTVVGAVSPPGGDLSEPVTQTTLRVVKVFWALDASLAYSRHFPAINWLTSYSLYLDRIEERLRQMVGEDFLNLRAEAMRILQDEANLSEIVRLVGMDALSMPDRITMETARSIREDFLHQNAFNEVDTYTSLRKQSSMLKVILEFDKALRQAVEKGASLDEMLRLPVRVRIGRMKYVEESKLSDIAELVDEIKRQVDSVVSGGGESVA